LEFLHHFTKNSCTKTDIEIHELGLMLNAKNEHVVKVGMVFNVSLRFQNYAKDVVIYAHFSWILTFDQSLLFFMQMCDDICYICEHMVGCSVSFSRFCISLDGFYSCNWIYQSH
jgi:hypothetical protein